MVVTSFILLAAAGTAAGWYAHRAYMRINTWGRNMDEVDALFRFAEEGEEVDAPAARRVGIIRFDESSSEPARQDAIHAR